MKKIGEYTSRGSIRSDNVMNRIILDDGSFETGYRVVEFVIAGHDMDNTSVNNFVAKLLTDDDTSIGLNWNWDNNEEIAWSIYSHDANANSAPNTFTLVDPDNLIIRPDRKLNYFIRLEKYDISDSQAALAMVRNRSQA